MKRTPVQSSNLASIGYDSTTQELEVEFKNNTIYVYSNVPDSVHKGLMSASSHGEYFDKNVKKAGYKFKQIK